MKTPLDIVLKELRESKASYEQAVLAGKVAGYEEYKHLTGVIRGLTLAESITKDLVQKLENSDD
jgi:hypothetical protein